MSRRIHISNRCSRHGFTLLEVIVAVVMVSILIGALYSAFFGAVRLREKTYAAIEADLPKSYAISLIKQDIQNMIGPAGILAGTMLGGPDENMDENYDFLEFFTASGLTSRFEPWGDIQKVEYAAMKPVWSGDEEGNVLVRKTTRNLLATTAEDPDVQILLKRLQSLQVAFYDGQNWYDSWDSTSNDDELPVALRVRMNFVQPESEDVDERTELPVEVFVPIRVQEMEAVESTETETDEESSGQESNNGDNSQDDSSQQNRGAES